MTYTLEQIGKVVADVKSSWYFRVWSLGWLGLVIAFLVGFAYYSNEAKLSKNEPTWRLWVKDYSDKGLKFPSFRIEVEDPATMINGEVWCSHDLKPLPCVNIDTRERCQLIPASHVTAHPKQATIECRYNVTGASSNHMAAIYLTEAAEPIYVAPNLGAHLSVWQEAYKPSGQDTQEYWNGNLVYHSTSAGNTTYLTIQVSRFWVEEYQEYAFYNGWMSAADMGGFAFLCSLILTGVMALVGLGLGNDSQFLGGVKNNRGENSPIY